MKKIFLAGLLLLMSSLCLPAIAQQKDSLWVKRINNSWQVIYSLKEGETVFQVAELFAVPPAELASGNGIAYNTRLPAGSLLYIPLSVYNRISKPDVPGSRALYYKTNSGDDWQTLAYLAGTSAEQLRRWNGRSFSALKKNETLLVGWVAWKSPKIAAPQAIHVAPADTLMAADTLPAAPVISKEEEQFNLMTMDGQNVQSEKGAAIFFDSKTSGATYYAFFNLAPRGAIIKIINPGNGQYVFAKVIGTIPEQERYQNALLGLSISAQKVLGGKGSRTWCEVQY